MVSMAAANYGNETRKKSKQNDTDNHKQTVMSDSGYWLDLDSDLIDG